MVLRILPTRVSGSDCYNIHRTHFKRTIGRYTSLHSSAHVTSTRWCSTTLQPWSASVVVWKLFWSLEWSRWWNSSFLACTLTWPQPALFLALPPPNLRGYLKINVSASVVDTGEAVRRRIQQFASEVKNTGVIFERFVCLFSRRPELCVREHEGRFQHLSWEGKKQRDYQLIEPLFFLFVYTTR